MGVNLLQVIIVEHSKRNIKLFFHTLKMAMNLFICIKMR